MDEDTATAADAEGGAPISVWIGLICVSVLSFWSQATVTEERFVPALNVIANYFKIPDDVAGATLMAAGASSPELFSSIIALFVTHSALGLGTIVGSEVFNQLMICAGSVQASRTGSLKLDKAIVTREVGFYALSIVLLMIALRDTEPLESDPDGSKHIFIDFYDGLMLTCGYVAYVLVCANFDRIVSMFSSLTNKDEKKYDALPSATNGKDYGTTGLSKAPSKRVVTIDIPHAMPFLRAIDREPDENFVTPESKRDLLEAAKSAREDQSRVSMYMTPDGGQRKAPVLAQSTVSEKSTNSSKASRRNVKSVANSITKMVGLFSEGASVRVFDLLVSDEKPSDSRDMFDTEHNEFDETLSCFLWQRSLFYNKAKVAMGGWHLRWFTFTAARIISVPDRKNYDRHMLLYKPFYEIEVDEKRLIIKFVASSEKNRDYDVMAPSKKIFDEVVAKCEKMIEFWEKEDSTTIDALELSSSGIEGEGYADDEESLIAFPAGGTWYEVIIYIILFPLKLLMHLTVPDVRHINRHGDPSSSVLTAFIASVSCLIWLIVGSYAMVSSLEALAELLDIPDAVVGATVSAAGTSLPNYVASQCAAKQGFGNCAVSNAFGSNTFNILVGLGVPWLLYTAIKGETYNGLRDDGIVEMVIVLGSVLLVFIIFILLSGFRLFKWHAVVFTVMYAAYLIYTVGVVYLRGMSN